MPRRLHLAASLALLFVLLSASLLSAAENDKAENHCDLLIRGAKLIDGTGADGVVTDVAITDGRIARIGKLDDLQADKTIDAAGLVLCPGFVDLHSHADRSILKLRDAENYVRQGVTTLVVGNCGSSPVDATGFFHALHDGGAGVNIVLLIGHGSVRVAEVGDRSVAPTPEQLAGMQRRVRQMMEAGAVGLSTGLRYRPGAYAETPEVIAVTREIAPYGGFYATHMRNEGEQIMDALEEALRIGREAGVPVHVSHHKISSASVWGLTRLTLARIDQARTGGMDVTLDHYPYGAGSSGISLMVPQPLVAGGAKAFRERIAAPGQRKRTLEAVEQLMIRKLFEPGQDPERSEHVRVALARIQIARLADEPALEGKNLTEILDLRKTPVTLRSGAELIVELVGKGASAIYHTIDDRPGGDVDRVMQYPYTSISSDGSVVVFGEGHPHPRSYGTYPRVLARYVRERHVISLETAIHKMTGLPAARLGWTDRGLIKPGYRADVVLFDPERIRDTATFARPHQYAEGVEHVLIGGEFVLEAGKMTGHRPGRPVYSVPVAASPEAKLRRDVLALLTKYDARCGVLAVSDDGREVFAFNADDRFYVGGGKDAAPCTLRELKPHLTTADSGISSRPHSADEKQDGIDLAIVSHAPLTGGGHLHVIAALSGVNRTDSSTTASTLKQQLVKLLNDHISH